MLAYGIIRISYQLYQVGGTEKIFLGAFYLMLTSRTVPSTDHASTPYPHGTKALPTESRANRTTEYTH